MYIVTQFFIKRYCDEDFSCLQEKEYKMEFYVIFCKEGVIDDDILDTKDGEILFEIYDVDKKVKKIVVGVELYNLYKEDKLIAVDNDVVNGYTSLVINIIPISSWYMSSILDYVEIVNNKFSKFFDMQDAYGFILDIRNNGLHIYNPTTMMIAISSVYIDSLFDRSDYNKYIHVDGEFLFLPHRNGMDLIKYKINDLGMFTKLVMMRRK